jgi:site-specific recombinase XerD
MVSVRGVYDPRKQREMHNELFKQSDVLGLLWLLGCSTGYRISDLLGSRVINYCQGQLLIVEAKTGKTRNIVLHKEARKALNQHIKRHELEFSDHIFFGYTAKKPITRQYAHAKIKSTGAYLGVEGLGTHTMRKTYAWNLLRSTLSFEAVQRALNHKYMSVTMLYLFGGLLELVGRLGERGGIRASQIAE